MNLHNYVLIYPILRNTYQLNGLKSLIQKTNKHAEFFEIFLFDKSTLTPNTIEYKSFYKKMIYRVIYYPKIFKNLDNLIDNTLAKVGKNSNVYLCIADEGIWGIYLKNKEKKLIKRKWKVRTINVQHGLFFLKMNKLLYFRRFVNLLFIFFTNYPILGLDFGGAKLDVYYVFSSKEYEFIKEKNVTSTVIISPKVCLYDTLMEIEKLDQVNNKKITQHNIILFAMQNLWVRKDILYREEELYKLLKPIFHLLISKYGYKILFRLHPGTQNRRKSIELLKKTGIYKQVEIDSSTKLENSIAKCSIVISFASTVLVYALYANRLPIVISGIFKEKYEFPSEHELISISNYEKDIEYALSKKENYFSRRKDNNEKT